jgi:hypothetical protein
MHSRMLRNLQSLELEERILNAGAVVAAVSVFLPWMSGEWLGGYNCYFCIGRCQLF